LQLTHERPAAVEIRPRDPQDLDPQSDQRTVARSIGVKARRV
jgi:hypothetical protein